MGIFRSIKNAFGGEMSDMYIEFFTCGDFMSNTLLVARGVRKNTTGNNKGSHSIISKGSQMVVPESTALILTDGGKVMECVETPGLFTWNGSSSKTILDGDSIADVTKDAVQRMKSAGEPIKEQRVYYVNLMEIRSNSFFNDYAIPYKDPEYKNIYLKMRITFSFRVCDPRTFFNKMCGNINNTLHFANVVTTQFNDELEDIASEVINGYGIKGIPYSHLMSYKSEFEQAIHENINARWKENRGIELVMMTMNVTIDDKSRRRLEQVDQAKIFGADPNALGAHAVISTTNAMNTAAGNPNGAAVGMAGLNMAANAATSPATTMATSTSATPSTTTASTPVTNAAPVAQTVKASSASPIPNVNKCPYCCYIPEGGIFLTRNCDCCGSLLG